MKIKVVLLSSCLLFSLYYANLSLAKPEIKPTGTAQFTKDGVTAEYEIVHGAFSSNFRFPKRAVLEFSRKVSKDEIANPSRLKIVIDITKAGEYNTLDGNTEVEYVADGGQIFRPTEECFITIDNFYTMGSNNGKVTGKLKDCKVHSAGITYTVSEEFKIDNISPDDGSF